MVTMNSTDKTGQKSCQTAATNSSKGQSSSIHRSKQSQGGSMRGVSSDSTKGLTQGAAQLAVPNQSTIMANIPQPEEAPNYLVYKKMETIVEKMQDEVTGVPVRTVKSLMSKIPSVFTGSDLITWLSRELKLEDVSECLHLAHLLAAHGYLFPIDDHCLTVKNDNTYYRFQTPYFWPSNQWEPENTDYAVYLCKRTMQNKARLELADYEAESLARLQKMFSRKWEFIFMQAEAQSKVDKKRDKLERKVLDSQERAFWDVHRPMPGCVNTTEVDMKKACRKGKRGDVNEKVDQLMQRSTPVDAITLEVENKNMSSTPIVTITDANESEIEIQNSKMANAEQNTSSAPDQASPTVKPDPALETARRQLHLLKQRLERRNTKASKIAEACIAYYEQYAEYDAFLTSPEWPNPWIADTTELWDQDKQSCKEAMPLRRVRRWAFGLRELLQDPAGQDHFTRFLDKEFSGENLKFWMGVQELKALPVRQVSERAKDLWREFLASDAPCPVNVDAASREAARVIIEQGTTDRWCLDHAQAHVYHLMKSDSYSRYLRSEMYKDILNGSKKKTSVKGIRSIVSFAGRKEPSSGS